MTHLLRAAVAPSAVALASLMTLAIATPSQAHHACKPTASAGSAQHRVAATAHMKARQAWQVSVINKYSMHWAGWQYARNTNVICQQPRVPYGETRCQATARPCRAH